jgi:DNA-binding transcriptional regulator YdaS (Cro superfamily)
MKSKDVLEFFGGTNATARALCLSAAAVSQWGDEVPAPRRGHVELAMKAEHQRRVKEAKKARRKMAALSKATA